MMNKVSIFHIACGVTVFILCVSNYDVLRPIQKQLSGHYRREDSLDVGSGSGSSSNSIVVTDVVHQQVLMGTVNNNSSSFSNNNNNNTNMMMMVRQQRPLPLIPKQSQVSFCLLIKDDNDILGEWLAYHYHVMNMRRLIVAVDPDSQTSPDDVLKLWKTFANGNDDNDGHDGSYTLDYTLWNDEDFMPEYFWKDKDYSKVPDFFFDSVKVDPKTNMTSSQWHRGSTLQTMSQEDIKADLTRVNNHRFRQRRFVSQCYAKLKEEGRMWTVHIDTDEYLVVNPLLRQAQTNTSTTTTTTDGKNKGRTTTPSSTTTTVPIPAIPTAGSLVRFVESMYRTMSSEMPYTCLMMPTLRIGSKEDTDDKSLMVTSDGRLVVQPTTTSSSSITNNNESSSSPFQYELLETLRWMYHGNFTDLSYNGKAKSLINVATIPSTHPIFKNQIAHSIHEPMISKMGGSKYACQSNVRGFTPIWKRPLVVNHYLGSIERYLSREDVRRNEKNYNERSIRANIHKDDGWIRPWLQSFIQDHGLDKVKLVLGK